MGKHARPFVELFKKKSRQQKMNTLPKTVNGAKCMERVKSYSEDFTVSSR